MKNSTRLLLILGLVTIVATAAVPPWLYTTDAEGTHSRKSAGYFEIIYPPRPEIDDLKYGVALDYTRLLMEWIAISAAIGVAILTVPLVTRGKKEEKRYTVEEFASMANSLEQKGETKTPGIIRKAINALRDEKLEPGDQRGLIVVAMIFGGFVVSLFLRLVFPGH